MTNGLGRSPIGSGYSPKGGAAKASPAKPSIPNAGRFVFSDLAEESDRRWVNLFIDLIIAGWTAEDIAEGYGFQLPKIGSNA